MEETRRTLGERIEALHVLGLDRRYDDVLGVEDVDDGLTVEVVEADRAAFLAAGPAFDYRSQRWTDLHDHAHMASSCDLPLLFCGADRTSCVGLPAVGLAEVTAS